MPAYRRQRNLRDHCDNCSFSGRFSPFLASLSGENSEEVRDSGGSKVAETVVFRRWGYREFSYIRKTTLPCHSLTCLSRSFTSESRHGESGLPELADRPFDATVLVLPNKSFPRETLLGNKCRDYDAAMFPKAQPLDSNSILVLLPIIHFMDILLN